MEEVVQEGARRVSYDRAELPQAKTQPARSGAGAATALCYWAAEFFFCPTSVGVSRP